jgi:hypothetical protein
MTMRFPGCMELLADKPVTHSLVTSNRKDRRRRTVISSVDESALIRQVVSVSTSVNSIWNLLRSFDFCKRFARPIGHSGTFCPFAPFRICKLLILLPTRESDPVSGERLTLGLTGWVRCGCRLPALRPAGVVRFVTGHHILNNLRIFPKTRSLNRQLPWRST